MGLFQNTGAHAAKLMNTQELQEQRGVQVFFATRESDQVFVQVKLYKKLRFFNCEIMCLKQLR